MRIAGQISSTGKTAWLRAIAKYLTDPLTIEDERNVQELKSWYKSDMEIKKSIDEVSERISCLEVGLNINKKRQTKRNPNINNLIDMVTYDILNFTLRQQFMKEHI